MSNFRVGQKVVCVDDRNRFSIVPMPLIKGSTYVVRGVLVSPCCGHVLLDLGFASTTRLTVCGNCGWERENHGAWLFRHDRFRPVVEDLTAELASSWKESVTTEQEHVNEPERAHA